MRVLLAETSRGVVHVDGPHRGFLDGGAAFDAVFGLVWPFQARDGELVIDGAAVGRSLALEAADGFTFDGGRFRGSVELLARGNRVAVVNVLPLDEYLRGVVPAEMHASWPMEALKAQAIAARTYTLASLDARRDWDICATIDCQVYRGRDAENPRADRAIADTRGLVLTFGGGFARTYYHADSGGTVASSFEVWGTRAPYLVAIRDVPATSPHRSWRIRIDADAVARSATAAGTNVGNVTRVRVLATSESGRVTSVEVVGTAGGGSSRPGSGWSAISWRRATVGGTASG